MTPFSKTGLVIGMRCMIIRPPNSGLEHIGKIVELSKRHPIWKTQLDGRQVLVDFWETVPALTGINPAGERVRWMWKPEFLMGLGNPIVHMELVKERQEDCKSDPRLAGYILGHEAAYAWKQKQAKPK